MITPSWLCLSTVIYLTPCRGLMYYVHMCIHKLKHKLNQCIASGYSTVIVAPMYYSRVLYKVISIWHEVL